MTLNDPELREIVRNSIPVEINNKRFIVEEAKGGKCDGCYFSNQLKCPTAAVRMCTSNSGNIFKLIEHR